MTDNIKYDVIIIGGSYSGLSAGMALGRALKKVLIIDSGKPCNLQTPYSHNLITQDGKTPKKISGTARKQVEKYDTVEFYKGLAVEGKKTKEGFQIGTQSGESFIAKKLIFATGVKDIMPTIPGFAACWGISIIHCPYCHGYEVRNEKTGILGNGDSGFEFSKMVLNWTRNLTLFTNGKSNLTPEQTAKLEKHQIKIDEREIHTFDHRDGQLENITFKDGTKADLTALYARPDFEQHCHIPAQLGCELTEQAHVRVDMFQKTTVPGIAACGDNATPFRSVSNAIASGTMAGAMTNKEIIDEEF